MMVYDSFEGVSCSFRAALNSKTCLPKAATSESFHRQHEIGLFQLGADPSHPERAAGLVSLEKVVF